MSVRRTIGALTLAGLLALPLPARLAACAFHVTLTEGSLSDDIAASVEVIAARPSSADPFAFETVAVLRGVASGTAPPFIVDSVTRTRLAQNPDEAVLFARGADGTWTRLLVLDAATRPFVDRLLNRAAVWATPAGAAERRDAFARLLAHPDARLRRIALRELDALPYDVLRGGTYPVQADVLLRGVNNIDEMPFAPIRILLVGLDGGSAARKAITDRLAAMTAMGVDTNLGPWITAAIEIGGPAEIERVVLAVPDRLTLPQLTQIVLALSVHSAGGREIGAQVGPVKIDTGRSWRSESGTSTAYAAASAKGRHSSSRILNAAVESQRCGVLIWVAPEAALPPPGNLGQSSMLSAIDRASSSSTPRYLTVLSILVWPSSNWTARRLPVFL